ncbi:MAG: DUF560 domain-containing protein [Alphaproteobacteria bacterium]|nr:DUF560 domain-containing protein [Alphaproteobacteria bacterium]
MLWLNFAITDKYNLKFNDRDKVENYEFTQKKERDVTQRYAVSLSNRKLEFGGFVPALTYIYG